jgi:hypothetical protein
MTDLTLASHDGYGCMGSLSSIALDAERLRRVLLAMIAGVWPTMSNDN